MIRARPLVAFLSMVLGGAPVLANALSPAELLRAEAKELSELARIERRFVEAELALARATAQRSAVDDTLARASRVLSSRTETLARQQAALRRRLRALSRVRAPGLIALLLGSRRLSDLRKQRRAVAARVREDVRQIAAFRAEVARIRAIAAMVESQREVLENARRKVEARRAKLLAMRQAREKILARLHERGVPAKLARARGRLERRLRGLVRALRSEVSALRSPLKLRGRLPHPVLGPVEVPFGTVREPPFGAVTMHPGWRYRATKGTPVRAVFAGRVVYARALAGYGPIVIIDHGAQFHTLSAHLARIDVRLGQAIATGDVIGLVGGAETPRGEGLYFEIRRAGRPVDPAGWLGQAAQPTAQSQGSTASDVLPVLEERSPAWTLTASATP
jgi:septal ring factor EnvC (AmiA/AmiB activator)